MTLYTKQVIMNPINLWLSGRDYFIGNTVIDPFISYRCVQDHTSSTINRPVNVAFWAKFSPGDHNVDISDFVETVLDTEIGSGEVRSCVLRLNADRGAFITDRNDGLTPIVDQFIPFTIKLTDQDGVLYLATHLVDVVHPTQDGLQGKVLPIDLLAPEFYLQRTLFADQFFFKSMFDVSKGIIDLYNKNKGGAQTRVVGADADSSSGGFNDLAKFTANDYTFNLKEMTHYDGLIQVMDRGGSSVAAQGAGDFFEIGFTTNPTNKDEINFRGFSSGNPADQISIPNIKSDDININPAEYEGQVNSTVGSVVGTWTDSSIGTLPRKNADFIGALEAWRLFPQYVTGGVLYPKDVIILVVNTLDSQSDSFHYKANKDTTLVPPVPPSTSNADWDQYFFTDFLINEVNYNLGGYSFFTDAKSAQWKSNGAKTAGTLQDDPPVDGSFKVWDSNQVKIDGKLRQTWVDVRATSELTIPAAFIRNGNVYRGFRVLVDGVGAGDFTGFDNDIIQWDGTQWLIFKRPETDNLVGVDEEARTYQFDTDTPGAWADVTTSIEQANDVYHSVYDIFNSQGHNNKNNGGGNFGQTSAVTYEFRYSKSDSIFGFGQPTFYRQFAGASFRVPYPFNSNNGNTIGKDYGDSDDRLPATFEAENMGLTSSGLSGFNNLESEDLGPFDALTFFIIHDWRYNKNGSGALVLTGNFAYRCALYDIDDTVVIQDFVVPFNNLWESVSLPIGGFKTYKARAAWAFGEAVQNIFLQELEILNSFRWRNIKKIAIHWLGPYDDQGRFQPWGQIDFLFPSIVDVFSGLFVDGFNVKLSIDSFQWSKPGLSLSPPNTERPLQPEFYYEPLITNKIQNNQANLAKLEITKFRHKEFEVTTVGLNDLGYGDSFFLENKHLINDADRTTDDLDVWVTATDYTENINDIQDSSIGYRCVKTHLSSGANQPPNTEFWSVADNPFPNTIKLVVKKIVRGIDKKPDGPSGYLRTLYGVRRFTEEE